MELALVILLFLFLKHMVWDYFWQPQPMLVGKAVYGDPWGLLHSLLHGISTFVVLTISLAFGAPLWILALGLLDFGIHYHIDFIKAHFGPKDPSKPIYWKWHGIDQALHYMTYLVIVLIAL